MNRSSRLSFAFEILIFAVSVFVLWLFNQAYITPILIGFIFATLVYPIYWRLLKLFERWSRWKYDYSSLAALITIVFFLVLLGVFSNFFVRQLINEIPAFIDGVRSYILDIPNNSDLLETADQLGIKQEDVEGLAQTVNEGVNNWLQSQAPGDADNLQNIVNIGTEIGSFIVDQIVYLVIFFIAWFSSLTSGARWVDSIFELLPIQKEDVVRIKSDLRLGVRNVVYANIVSGLIHAAFVFLVMFFFQLPNIFIITFLVFLIGFLPLSPSELAYLIPLGMLFSINPIAALVVAIVAEGVILWVNYILLPSLITSNEEGNTLLILTSVLSGIAFFGPMGFLIGPVIMILIQTMFGIARRRYIESNKLDNAN